MEIRECPSAINQTYQQELRNANTVTYNNDKMFNLNHRMNVMLVMKYPAATTTKTTMTSVGFP